MKLEPPSTVIAEAHKKATKQGHDLSSEEVTALAKEVLLTEDDVRMWIEHLRDVATRQKEGAKKAAATRSKAKNSKNKRDQSSTSSPLDTLDGKFGCS